MYTSHAYNTLAFNEKGQSSMCQFYYLLPITLAVLLGKECRVQLLMEFLSRIGIYKNL